MPGEDNDLLQWMETSAKGAAQPPTALLPGSFQPLGQ